MRLVVEVLLSDLEGGRVGVEVGIFIRGEGARGDDVGDFDREEGFLALMGGGRGKARGPDQHLRRGEDDEEDEEEEEEGCSGNKDKQGKGEEEMLSNRASL